MARLPRGATLELGARSGVGPEWDRFSRSGFCAGIWRRVFTSSSALADPGGPLPSMPGPQPSERASMLLVEECFSRQSEGFLTALRLVAHPKVLAAFADRWKKDARPWAREQIFAYLEQPLDCPGHQPLVKHLFKDAEERKDDELMAAFLVAFDTLVRRVRRKTWKWDRATRSALEGETLGTPRDVLPAEVAKTYLDPKTGERVTFGKKGGRVRGGKVFSHRTRQYLRRRAWRYFRWMAFARPEAYAPAILPALRRYRDEDLEKGENILDSWALLQICFYGGDVIEFHSRHHRLREGRTLAELRAAPRFPEAWDKPDVARAVLRLVSEARATLVRCWAMDLFRGLASRAELTLSPDEFLALLDHADERVQQFGAELFDAQAGNERLPVTDWLRLLRTKNLTALATLCAAFERHVSGERLTLDQCLDLATARPTPVARLGFQLLQARTISATTTAAGAGAAALGRLADARCEAVAGELTAWALARVGADDGYEMEATCRFFDSVVAATRAAAWAWLTTRRPDGKAAATKAYADPVLWSRLAETPFEDLRLRIVDHLALRLEQPELSADQLAPVWCAVLLGVHRGGRQKLKAVRELADAIAREPEKAAGLLPVLVVAVRSVRGPEMRAGLAAVLGLVARRPELAAAVRERLPELSFGEIGEAAA